MNVLITNKNGQLTKRGFKKLDTSPYILVQIYTDLISIEGVNSTHQNHGTCFKDLEDPKLADFLKKHNFEQAVFTEIDGVYYENPLKENKFIQEALNMPDNEFYSDVIQ